MRRIERLCFSEHLIVLVEKSYIRDATGLNSKQNADKPVISRRDLLMTGGGIFATAVITQVGGDVVGIVRDTTARLLDKDEYEIDAIKTVFGPIDKRSSFIPGQSHPHPRYQGAFHPDDEYVADVFDELVRDVAEDRLTYDTNGIPQSLEGISLISGSPVSNATTRYLFEFDYVDPNDKMAGLARVSDPVFETDFEFLLEKDALAKLGISEKVGKRGISGNWSIANTRSGKLYSSKTKDGRLMSDYLLVTRLPNVFDKASYERNDALFVFAGTHGIGTKATDILLKDKILLDQLYKRIDGTMYWQALFEIDDVDHYHRTEKFGVRWHPTSVSQDFEFAPVSFDVTRFQEMAHWS